MSGGPQIMPVFLKPRCILYRNVIFHSSWLGCPASCEISSLKAVVRNYFGGATQPFSPWCFSFLFPPKFGVFIFIQGPEKREERRTALLTKFYSLGKIYVRAHSSTFEIRDGKKEEARTSWISLATAASLDLWRACCVFGVVVVVVVVAAAVAVDGDVFSWSRPIWVQIPFAKKGKEEKFIFRTKFPFEKEDFFCGLFRSSRCWYLTEHFANLDTWSPSIDDNFSRGCQIYSSSHRIGIIWASIFFMLRSKYFFAIFSFIAHFAPS